MFTTEQQAAIKADILANPDLDAFPNTVDGAFGIRDLYAVEAVPLFWVWKTQLHEHEITGESSPDGTLWDWSAYISRSVGERDGWVRMFNTSLTINPSLPNVRQGIGDIFSGGTGTDQRAHLLAIARRNANRLEALLATGTGSTVSPATMTFVGAAGYQDIYDARNS